MAQPLADSTSRSPLGLTVVFTSLRGTMAALARAERLARGLDVNLTLLIPQVVPYRIPITCPPVAICHTRQTVLSMISTSALKARDVNIQICLCRDRTECLRWWLGEGAIVLLGGRASWWPMRERRLGKALRAMGCEVVFADQEGYHYA